MTDLLEPLWHFFEAYGIWIAISSILIFLISLASIPTIVANIPVDYFTSRKRHKLIQSSYHPLVKPIIVGLKNLAGLLLVLTGIIMLFTPGQGLLSILFGLMIMNYPGKFQLERWIISRPPIWRAVNNLRIKHKKEPLLAPEAADSGCTL